MNAFLRVFATLMLIVGTAFACIILFNFALATGVWPPGGGSTPTPVPVSDPGTGPTAAGGGFPVESGSMPIGGVKGGTPDGPTRPMTETEPPVEPVTPDPCPPVAAPGFITGTLVYAINQVRLYTKPDTESPGVAEFSRGQSFVVTPDLDGTTAITRCGTLWVLVQGPQGQIGWVLGAAVSIDPIPIDPIITPNPCPGGCGTPVPIPTCTPVCPTPACVQPCPNPCSWPCP